MMDDARRRGDDFCQAIEFILRLRYRLYVEPRREYETAGEPLGPDGLDVWLEYGTLTTVK